MGLNIGVFSGDSSSFCSGVFDVLLQVQISSEPVPVADNNGLDKNLDHSTSSSVGSTSDVSEPTAEIELLLSVLASPAVSISGSVYHSLSVASSSDMVVISVWCVSSSCKQASGFFRGERKGYCSRSEHVQSCCNEGESLVS